jgi:hypothetical protein
MKPTTSILWLLSIGFWLIPAWGQAPPSDLRDWELICFCSGRDKGPDEIVREDTNGQILFAARRGTTRQRLKDNHIEFSESQIDLLVSWRLLAEQGGQLKTQMPILGPDEMTRLRAVLHVQAVELGGSLLPDIKTFVSLLNQRGYRDEAYTIVFSYLLDNLVWDDFDQRHVLPSMEITADRPFWSGALWAVYPRRGAPGTNTRPYGGWTLSVMWTQPVQPLLAPLYRSSLVEPFLADLEKLGSVSDPGIRSQMLALGIVAADGKPTVPIIREVNSDAVFASSRAIAHKVSEGMLRAAQSPDLFALAGTGDRGVALIVAYHEFMWELLAYLEQAKVVLPPAIVSAKTPADPRQVHDLVFIVVPEAK